MHAFKATEVYLMRCWREDARRIGAPRAVVRDLRRRALGVVPIKPQVGDRCRVAGAPIITSHPSETFYKPQATADCL